MVVRPWIVPYSAIDLGVRVAGAFCTKLPDRPVLAMLIVKKFDQGVGRIAVSSLRVGGRWAGGSDY